MKDYTRGLRDGMLETAKADLEQVATRIAILEEDLHKDLITQQENKTTKEDF